MGGGVLKVKIGQQGVSIAKIVGERGIEIASQMGI
jgi:hypothetical protein